jgi:hypothetical protein
MYPKSYPVLIIACLPLLLFSQNTRFGLKGGLNLSHDKFQNYNNGVLLDLVSEADQYFHIGGLIEFMIPDKKTQFQLEVLYTGGGTIIQESEISNRIEINVNQLALPLIVKFEVTEDWSFISGSYLGYILNAKEKNRWGTTVNIKDDFQLLDFGFVSGFELRVNNSLFFDVRYNFGLLNFNDSNPFAGIETERIYKNRTVHYGVVYKF